MKLPIDKLIEHMKYNLTHLAVIMDGNARWASKHGKAKSHGHHLGAKNATKILRHAMKLNIKHLTFYAFSSENWQRPATEVAILVSLLNHYVRNETEILKRHQIKLQIIGDLKKLPYSLIQDIKNSMQMTQNNTQMTVNIAFSYGGREEITHACQKAIDSGITQVSEKNFKHFLYDPNMPDVDILIRTGGTHRISNFLLWHISYAEIYFLDKLWPDFNEEDLNQIINNYSQRVRNFGAR